jgi:sodium transport system permease protein
MRSMWVIFSKELLDIVRDRRRFVLTLLSLFVFFPLLFIVPYGYMITRVAKQATDMLAIPVQGMDNAPGLIAYLAEHDIQAVAAVNVETLVNDRQYTAGLIIPDDYEKRISSGDSVELTIVADLRQNMNVSSTRLKAVLEKYGTDLLKSRLEQRGLSEDFFTPLTIKQLNAATETETTGSRLGFIIPGVIISLALSAGMPIAVSSVAGEKKKLTLEPVLFTTVSRFQLVLAKVLAVLAVVLLTFISLGISTSIMGLAVVTLTARNLPVDRIAAAASEAAPTASSADMLTGGYHLQPLAILLFLLAPLLIVLLGAALQILVSSWARTDEEANTYLAPLNLAASAIIMVTIFMEDFAPHLWHYGFPVFGTILSMRDLLSNKVDPASLAVMFVTSGLYALSMIALAVWMFHREEVVFRT